MDTSISDNPARTELPKTELPTNALLIKATLKEAWGYVSGFKSTYWLALLTIVAIAFVFGFFQGILDPNYLSPAQMYKTAQLYSAPVVNQHHSGSAFILGIIGNIINYLLGCGITYIGLRRASNLPIMTRMMFKSYKSPLIFKLLGLALVKLLIILGFVLILIIVNVGLPHVLGDNASDVARLLLVITDAICFVFFVYLFMRLALSMPAVLDKGLNPFEAIAFSFHATMGYVWRIFWINFLIFLILLISIIPLGIGLIWSLPFTALILPTIYKRLAGISMKE